ncbi:unnamed protein product [Brassica rapa]|uniref:Uncharacterized protein n=1 Tax=Brassica campestris TaxID=3711 RepID=A0A3P6ARW6_BRACM|nr:unnamed protein product [Brassica rapa]VDC88090.1 unnamed protein product [Brassica rapa]
MQSKLLYHINKNYPLMQCNMYRRKILEKLNAHPVVDSPSSPYQQLRHDTLRAYETMYGSLDNHYSLGNILFSPLSDLQILESCFGRLSVSDPNTRQQQLLNHGRSN